MAKVKPLPSHTTRYWAEQCYRLLMTRGRHMSHAKTVQGVELTIRAYPTEGYVDMSYVYNGVLFNKQETIRKCWMH